MKDPPVTAVRTGGLHEEEQMVEYSADIRRCVMYGRMRTEPRQRYQPGDGQGE